MRTIYSSTDSLSLNAVLVDDWVLNIKSICEDYVLTKNSGIPDLVIDDGGSVTVDGYPDFSYDGPVLSCAPEAELYLFQNNLWVL
jgi:hypothetical protein